MEIVEEVGKEEVLLPHRRKDWELLKELLETTTPTNEQEYTELVKRINKSTNHLHVVALEVYPIVRQLILELPSQFPDPVYYLLSNEEGTLFLSRKQAACLLACSFLGLFERRYYQRPKKRQFPDFDITQLFFKQFMRCLVCYFKAIEQKMPEGYISITRKVLRKDQVPDYSKSENLITDIQVTSSLIESFTEHRLHADFANKSIGGGVLHGGNVQEEILFVIKPECLVSMLFCEVMDGNEAVIITGAEQFSKYTGYGGTMRFEGEFQNTTETFRDEEGRTFINNSIVAFDAIMVYGINQFDIKMINRDINKAYIALRGEKKIPNEYFVTGNWGCGVFGGDRELKAVQQMIASSEVGINLVYSAFTQEKFKIKLEAFVKFLQNHKVTVGQLYNTLLTYPTFTTLSVFEHIIKEIDPTSSQSEQQWFGWSFLQDMPLLGSLMDMFKGN